MLPKVTQPLAKSIRTGEGILVYASNVALGLLGALPHGLSWEKSALFATILNGLHVLSRSGLKMTAVNAAIGIGEPIELSEAAVPYEAKALAEIHAVEVALEKLQSEPGTPAEKVTQGLNPTPVQS